MSEDLASLGIAVDSSQTKTAAAGLDALTASAVKAQAATVSLAAATKTGSATLNEQTALAAKIAQALQEQAGVSKAMAVQQANDYAGVSAAAKAEADAIKVAKAAETAAVIAGNDEQIASNVKLGLSSRQVREIISATRFSIEGQSTRAIGSLTVLAQTLSAPTLAKAGWIALAVAAIGSLIYVVNAGEQELAKFNNSLVATGNYAGITAGQFEEMAHRLATANNQALGSVKASIETLVSSGQYSKDTIESMTQAAIKQSQITGVSVDKIVGSYEQAKGGIIKFAVAHEEAFHDITLAQLDYINTLEKQGDHQKAEKVLFDDIANTMEKRSAPAYGVLQQAIHETIIAANNLWDAILGIGRPATVQDVVLNQAQKVSGIAAELQAASKNPENYIGGHTAASLKAHLQQQMAVLRDYQGVGAGQAVGAGLDSAFSIAQDNAIRAKYDNEAHKGPKPKAVQEDKVGKFEDDTANINSEAAGLLKIADAYNADAFAAMQAKAQADAYNAVLKASQGVKGEAISRTDLDARVTANMNKEIATFIDASAKQANTLQERATEQEAVNALVVKGTITEADARREVQQAVITQGLMNIILKGTADQAAAAYAQLSNMTVAQNKLNQADATAQLIALNKSIKPFGPLEKHDVAGGQNDQSIASEAQANLQKIVQAEQQTYQTRLQNRKAYENQMAYLELSGAQTRKQSIISLALFDAQTNQARLQNTSTMLNALSSLQGSKSKELQAIGKVAAIASATIDTFSAVNKALAALPYPANLPGAIAVGIMGAANVAKIAGLREGGFVTGDGGPRDDKVPARLSTGEAVISAEATARNRPLIEQIMKSGRVLPSQAHAYGGVVGSYPSAPSSGPVIHVDMSQANFGGADPDIIMQRFETAMKTVYGPAIVVQAAKTTMTTEAKQRGRQVLNRKTGAQR